MLEKERVLSESSPADQNQPKRLSKQERRELLEQLERASSRSESAEAVLTRVETAIGDGRLDEAESFLSHLETTAPTLAGLDLVKDKLNAARSRSKQQENVRAAEDILSRYIQQRKKALAQLALQTLSELEPLHPRLADYRVWVGELDQEMAFHQRLESVLAAGREAILANDLPRAERSLADLRKLDADSPMAETLAAELDYAHRGRAETGDIENSKERLETLMAGGQVREAEMELERLARMAVPKITLDFFQKRLEGIQSDQEARSLLAQFRGEFRRKLHQQDWDGARDVAQKAGGQTGSPDLSAQMFNEVDRHESEQRHRQSLTQGLSMLSKFIAEGKKGEAELALKVLQSLDLEPQRLAELERKVRAL